MYLVTLGENSRKLVTEFRLSNHKLPVEKGRHSDICKESILGDEFHILLECKNEDIVKSRSRLLRYINHILSICTTIFIL